MEPEDYRRLEEIAAGRGVSVAELVRTAVRDRYLGRPGDRARAVAAILALSLPLDDWPELEAEIAEAHGGGVP
jgi:hypothetical protein